MTAGHSNSAAPCAACGDLEGCHLPRPVAAAGLITGVATTPKAIDDLCDEILRARNKFPGNKHLLAALTEEVGELARELLQHGNTEHARKEALQVACVALRIATEGDPLFDHLEPEQRKA